MDRKQGFSWLVYKGVLPALLFLSLGIYFASIIPTRCDEVNFRKSSNLLDGSDFDWDFKEMGIIIIRSFTASHPFLNSIIDYTVRSTFGNHEFYPRVLSTIFLSVMVVLTSRVLYDNQVRSYTAYFILPMNYLMFFYSTYARSYALVALVFLASFLLTNDIILLKRHDKIRLLLIINIIGISSNKFTVLVIIYEIIMFLLYKGLKDISESIDKSKLDKILIGFLALLIVLTYISSRYSFVRKQGFMVYKGFEIGELALYGSILLSTKNIFIGVIGFLVVISSSLIHLTKSFQHAQHRKIKTPFMIKRAILTTLIILMVVVFCHRYYLSTLDLISKYPVYNRPLNTELIEVVKNTEARLHYFLLSVSMLLTCVILTNIRFFTSVFLNLRNRFIKLEMAPQDFLQGTSLLGLMVVSTFLYFSHIGFFCTTKLGIPYTIIMVAYLILTIEKSIQRKTIKRIIFTVILVSNIHLVYTTSLLTMHCRFHDPARILDYDGVNAIATLIKPHVSISQLQEQKAEGTYWQEYGNTIFYDQGIIIKLNNKSKSAVMELTIDSNDEYEIILRAGDKTIDKELIKARTNQDGLVLQELMFNRDKTMRGYDNIYIKPVSGIEGYSIGHVRIIR